MRVLQLRRGVLTPVRGVCVLGRIVSRLRKLNLVYFIFSLYFLFYFRFIFLFSIFRTIRVRFDQSHCHISHNLMA